MVQGRKLSAEEAREALDIQMPGKARTVKDEGVPPRARYERFIDDGEGLIITYPE
jgi:hypothetical protein